jgi:DNA-binding cell septation regulator SpoVG
MTDEVEGIKTDHRYLTEVSFFPPPDDYVPSGDSIMRAQANLVFNDEYVCKDFYIFESDDGLWVSMPAEEDNQGNYHDRFFAVTEEGEEHLRNLLLKYFHQSDVSDMSAEDIRERAESQDSGSSGTDWQSDSSWGDDDGDESDSGWGDSGDDSSEEGDSFSDDTGQSDSSEPDDSSQEGSDDWGSDDETDGWGSDDDEDNNDNSSWGG